MTIDGGLRPLFRDRVPGPMHWQAVETGGTGVGVPDANFCASGVEGWVEYKATSTYAVPLLPEQVGWLMQRSRCGGRTFVAVRQRSAPGPRKGPGCDTLWLFRGDQARELLSGSLLGTAGGPLGAWQGGPARWAWVEVRRLLLTTPPSP